MEIQATNSFAELKVWQKSHKLVLDIYQMTKDFPKGEQFGLISQMRRAAVSIPANIAEGYRRFTSKDKARLINIAQGSLEELRYYLLLSHDLGYADTDCLSTNIDEISRMLFAYHKAILSNN